MASETGQERTTAGKPALLYRARRYWPVVVVVGVLLMWSHFQQQLPAVTYATAHRAPLTLTVAASGKVDGDSSDLAFTGAGKIISLPVKEGDTIAAQQLLARLNLGGTGVDDVIQAPYDGSVTNVYRRLGEVVNSGTPVLRVVRRGNLYVTAYLDSEDATWVKSGDQFLARAGGYLARGWNLRVQSIGAEAVPREDVIGSARQVRARLSVVDGDFSLPLGTAVDIDGTVEIAHSALQVPASAVVREDTRTFVWRVVDEKVQQVDVTLGPNNFRNVIIKSGLAEGDAVVIEGKTDLKIGQMVSATPWQEPQP